MPERPTHSRTSDARSRRLLGPPFLRQYAAYSLVAWRPEGALDDLMLERIAQWLLDIERNTPPFKRFVDFSRLTTISVRTRQVFAFAQKRKREFVGNEPVRTALFCEEWVGFGVARLYEALMKESRIEARAFRDRVRVAQWLGVPVEVLSLTDEPEPA